MAATGNEVPLLSQLRLFKDWVSSQFNNLKTNLVFGNPDGPLPRFHGYLKTLSDEITFNLSGQAGQPTSVAELSVDSSDDGETFTCTMRLGSLYIYSRENNAGQPISTSFSIGGQSADLGTETIFATATTDGLMSKEDKSKLDSITVSSVDIVKADSHKTTYTKDTLEIVTNSTGKVTEMYFISV